MSEINFADLMPKEEEGKRMSLRELLRRERAREGRNGNEDWIKQMTKRGGYGGQFE